MKIRANKFKLSRNKRYAVFILALMVLGASVFFFDKVEKEETKILVVGDMMFDRTIRRWIYEHNFDHIFSCVSETLQNYDYVVGNLEGPITAQASVSLVTVPGDLNNMKFTFPSDTARMLEKYNFGAVSLGNNHILNFGNAGLVETREFLKQAEIDWFGDPYDANKKSFTKDNISFIGFNQFYGVDSREKTVQEIKNKKAEGNIAIVFAHWGEEYIAANQTQKSLAYSFIDAGADLVIGAHPHVIQEIETYKNKKIYYSLGNFIFDQWWEDAVRKGMGVEILIERGKIKTSEIFFESNRDGRTCPE